MLYNIYVKYLRQSKVKELAIFWYFGNFMQVYLVELYYLKQKF